MDLVPFEQDPLCPKCLARARIVTWHPAINDLSVPYPEHVSWACRCGYKALMEIPRAVGTDRE